MALETAAVGVLVEARSALPLPRVCVIVGPGVSNEAILGVVDACEAFGTAFLAADASRGREVAGGYSAGAQLRGVLFDKQSLAIRTAGC